MPPRDWGVLDPTATVFDEAFQPDSHAAGVLQKRHHLEAYELEATRDEALEGWIRCEGFVLL